jgi:hypothetical protein
MALLVVSTLGPLACNKPGTSTSPVGTARVVVRPLVPESYLGRVTVTVTEGGGPAMAPMVASLDRSGSQWIGRVDGIPAGPQRSFDVIAFDAQGRALFAASASADVLADQATVVSISLDNRSPGTFQNAFPVIDSVTWTPAAPHPLDTVRLHVSAHDPDPGDVLSYDWSSTCGTVDAPASTTPTWTAPAQPGSCVLSVAVTDSHAATVGFDFVVPVTPVNGGGDVTATVNSWPVIDSLGGALAVWNGGISGDLVVTASDPDGDSLSYSWQSNCAGIAFDVRTPYSLTTPHVTLPAASAPCTVSVAVWDGVAPRPTLGSLFLGPEVVLLNCQNVVCPAGQACDAWDGFCKPTGSCTASCTGKACGSDGCTGSCGTCAAGAACSASGQCVPVCLPACTGKVCGPDGCGGICGSCSTNATCNGTTGQCVCAPACTGRACGPDGCGGSCGTCTSGACNAVTGQCSCTPSCTGRVCGSDGCGGSCGSCSSGTCNDAAGQCSCTPSCAGRICGSDGCGGSCGTCSTGTCDSSGQCSVVPTGVVPSVARDLLLAPGSLQPAGLAMDGAGATFVAGSFNSAVPVDFQTAPGKPAIPLQPIGGYDIFVGRYDTTGNIVWGVDIGDDDGVSANDQKATGAAVNAAGRVGIIGSMIGSVTFGSSTVIGSSTTAYLAALSAADGSRLWGKGFNLGANGQFYGVAASPQDASGRFAVCGQASQAATTLVPGATYGGLADLVIAVFDSSGNRLWSRQIGGAGNENCRAIAVDDAGNVYAAGQYDGASITFPPLAAMAGPGATSRKFLWLAKFDGSTGNALAQASFSNASPATTPIQAFPEALAIDPTGNLLVGAHFSGTLVGGTATLTSAGGDDALVLKLDGATLAPAWNPVRFGGTGNDYLKGIASTPSGDIVVAGTVNPSSASFETANGGFDTNGAVQLTVNGSTAPDQFVVKLDGATGAAQDARTYGDTSAQNGGFVVVNRFAPSGEVTFVGSLSGAATFGAAGTLTAQNPSGLDVSLVFSELR